MNKADILVDIQSICREVFGMPELAISPSTSAADVEKWDSITNLFLIDAIESRFGMKFTLDEILEAENVGHLCDIIEKRKS